MLRTRSLARHAALVLVAAGLTIAGGVQVATSATAAPHGASHRATSPDHRLGARQLASVRARQQRLVAHHQPAPRFARAAATTFTVNTIEDSTLANAAGKTCVDTTSGKCSLRAAVSAANNLAKPVRIVLSAKTYMLSTATVLTIDNPAGTSIVGKGSSKTTIQGAGSGLFDLHGTTSGPLLFLSGLKLTGGTTDRGGALYLDSSVAGPSLVLDGVVLSGNSATDYGGALYADDYAAIYARNTTFTGNSSPQGGGLYTYWSDVDLVNTKITGNHTPSGSEGDGGGWRNEYGSVRMSGGSISNNTAGTVTDQGLGGGFYDDYGVVAFSGVHLDKNTANSAGNGGGVYLFNDQVEITGGTISGNHAQGADGAGGGLYVSDGTLLGLHGVTMKADRVGATSNSGAGGGAIFVYGKDYGNQITIDSHTSITEANGSAVYIFATEGHLDLSVGGSTLSGNTDTSQNAMTGYGCGGAICAYAVLNSSIHLEMTGNKVTKNSSAGASSGGAVSVFGDSNGTGSVYLRGNHFDANSTGANGFGGALLLWDNGSSSALSARLASNTFTGNRAGTAASRGYGGAVAVDYYVAFSDHGSTFSGNRAVGDGAEGGAVYNASQQAERFVGTTFTGNSAGAGTPDGYGGAVYSLNDAGDSFTGVTMSGNSAASYGGAFYGDNRAYDVVLDSSTVSGNTAGSSMNEGSGGGLYLSGALAMLVNSTLTGNKAVAAGGFPGVGGAISVSGSRLGVRYSTITGNVAKQGGGVWADAYGGSFLGSIVAGNKATAGGAEQDCRANSPSAALHSLGGNVLGQGGCVTSTASSDKVTTKPGLGPLKANGGPTKTMALSAKSPAIGRASFLVPPKDQRGKKRPAKHADAGAYERP